MRMTDLMNEGERPLDARTNMASLSDASSDGSIRSRITRDLAIQIMSGKVPPGSRLPVEADLITALGVSRTVVREAVRTLAAKGIIVSRKKAGTIVRPMQDWNLLDGDVQQWLDEVDLGQTYMKDISEARLIFEPKAARLAALRASQAELAQITDAYRRMRSTLENDLERYTEADLAFHQSILSASHNYVLSQMGKGISATLRRLLRASVEASGDYARGIRAHGDVLAAIRNRDPDEAERTMRALIAVSADDLSLSDLQA
jgi:GntR family galactonate operon transcriptional repressor